MGISEIREVCIMGIEQCSGYPKYEIQEIASKKILDLQFNILDFCGCGRSDDIPFMIRDVLKAINNRTKNYYKEDLSFTEIYEQYDMELIDVLGFDSNNIAYDFILNTLSSAGLLEHGSSIRGSWLTDYGDEILYAFKIVGDDILDVDYRD